MSTQIHKITPETPSVFPCWLWHPQHNVWCAWKDTYSHANAPVHDKGYTHWSPDAPTAPTERPDAEPEYHGGKVHKEMEAQANAEQETLGGDDNALVQTSVQPGGIEPPAIPSDPASRAAPNNEAPPSEAGMAAAREINEMFPPGCYSKRHSVEDAARIIDRALDAERRAHGQIPRCEHCGSHRMVNNCQRCGAPMCCDQCCQITTLEAQLTASTDQYRQLVKEKIELEVELTALEKETNAASEMLDTVARGFDRSLARLLAGDKRGAEQELKLAITHIDRGDFTGESIANLRAEIERWRDSNIRLRDECEHQAGRALRAELDRDALKSERDGLRADGERLLDSVRTQLIFECGNVVAPPLIERVINAARTPVQPS